MKKRVLGLLIAFQVILILSGCERAGGDDVSLASVYFVTAMLSLILLICYLVLVKNIDKWFVCLFSSVLVVNVGYYLLAASTSLEYALWANRTAYLGSVFLPLFMLIIVMNVTNTVYRKRHICSLIVLSFLVFFVAASPGILPIYYKEVAFEVTNGVGRLIKTYGPLHILYLFYLMGYFAALVAVILRSVAKKRVESASHAVILAIAVFINIGVWFIEQITSINFEFLSVSYIISELFLLGVNLISAENQQLKELVMEKERSIQEALAANSKNETVQNGDDCLSGETVKAFKEGLELLTPTEKSIYTLYTKGRSTKEVLEALKIKENTLKFHNKNLYGKLGVSSRKQLVEVFKFISKND